MKSDKKPLKDIWMRNSPRFMGDLEQRPRVVEILGDVNGKNVLEAGCGEGYLARLIVKANPSATVYGIDNDSSKIRCAKSVSECDHHFSYHLGDITEMMTPEVKFDAITCVGVVHRLDSEELVHAMMAFSDVIGDKGKLVISTPHPYLFEEDSYARRSKCWVKYKPVKINFTSGKPDEFREEYFDRKGRSTDSLVYRNDEAEIRGCLNVAGFEVAKTETLRVRKEHLLHPSWGTHFGYPAYLIIKAVKGRRK